MRTDGAKGHLDLLLLSVLSGGAGHGYAVITALRERSDGTFDLAEGTVYPALHRLEQDSLLSSDWQAVGGRRRRVYQLTAQGAKALAREQREWKSLSRAVDSVLGRPAAAVTA